MKTIIEKIIDLKNQDLDNLPTSYIEEHNSKLNISELNHNIYYFHLQSGKEHYRLLMYIATLFENEIFFDIGTNKCMSALALSYNKKNKVKTYDLIKVLPENPQVVNIEYFIGDSTEDEDLKNSKLIFLDVDHDGLYENKFYRHLRNINWKGILLLDDIHLNESMIEFWKKIEEKKYDLTNIGHWSGTGLVIFD
jgi:hypothetical protein